MKIADIIAGVLFGGMFAFGGIYYFFMKTPETTEVPPPLVASFMAALWPSGYMSAVKVLEALGGLLVLSRYFTGAGLLILGPILLNILFFDIFLAKAFNPISTALVPFALFLLWNRREKFLAFAKS